MRIRGYRLSAVGCLLTAGLLNGIPERKRAPAHRAGWFRGERVLKMDGAFAPRVLRIDRRFASEGCSGALSGAI